MVLMPDPSNSILARLVSKFAAYGVDRRTGLAALTGLVLAGAALPAMAQGWWPFGDDEPQQRRQAPVPREPIYRDPATQAPPRQENWSGAPSGPSSICLQLEQRLAQEGQRGGNSRSQIPMVENELREADRAYRSLKQQLDRSDCYEYFLFSKTLRRTRRCVDMAGQLDQSRQRVDDLEVQLSQLQGSTGRSYQDEIVRELARNNCGANYQQQARRQGGGGAFSPFWEDEESSGYRDGGSSFGALPYATYRTVCVRLCDGYYFPVSFSTLPNHFQRDEELCQSKCAAPAQLYYHQNPGAGMEQAMAARTNEAYSQLKSAFRYRKEYVQGCSCKMAEYTPEPGALTQSGAGAAGEASGWAAQVPGQAGGEQQPLPPQDYDQNGGGESLPWSTTP